MLQGNEAVHARHFATSCPNVVRGCTKGGPLPTAPRQRSSVQHECPLPQGPQRREAVRRRSSTAHYPNVVRWCIEGVPLPSAL